MKKILTSVIVLLSLSFFSTKTFSQIRDGGGSADGGAPTQPCPVHFTRNNGDGTCGGEAQIRLYYTTAPTVAPILQSIIYQDNPLYTNALPITGNISDYATKGYVSFCLPTSNIPPAIKLTLVINYPNSSQQCTISGTE